MVTKTKFTHKQLLVRMALMGELLRMSETTKGRTYQIGCDEIRPNVALALIRREFIRQLPVTPSQHSLSRALYGVTKAGFDFVVKETEQEQYVLKLKHDRQAELKRLHSELPKRRTRRA